MDHAKAAQAIIDLINSKPSSPALDEIVAVLGAIASQPLPSSPSPTFMTDMHRVAMEAFQAAGSIPNNRHILSYEERTRRAQELAESEKRRREQIAEDAHAIAMGALKSIYWPV